MSSKDCSWDKHKLHFGVYLKMKILELLCFDISGQYNACRYSRYCLGNQLWSFHRWPWLWPLTYFSRSTKKTLNITFDTYTCQILCGGQMGLFKCVTLTFDLVFKTYRKNVFTPINTTYCVGIQMGSFECVTFTLTFDLLFKTDHKHIAPS